MCVFDGAAGGGVVLCESFIKEKHAQAREGRTDA
jgi:hypothetical protein